VFVIDGFLGFSFETSSIVSELKHASIGILVLPNDCIFILFASQAPKLHQDYMARVLGLPLSKVVCKTKRIGGGFGGKETRSSCVAAATCIPAYLLKRPVKITLDRDVDMVITGQRHSFIGKYKVSSFFPYILAFIV